MQNMPKIRVILQFSNIRAFPLTIQDMAFFPIMLFAFYYDHHLKKQTKKRLSPTSSALANDVSLV